MPDRTRIDRVKSKARSAIANGTTLFLGNVDGRSRQARRWRDLYLGFLARTNGDHHELCRQAATLVLQRELLDAAIVRGEPVDALALVRLAGSINRTLSTLNVAEGESESIRQRREREDREAGLIA